MARGRPTFFIPGLVDDEQAETVWRAVQSFASETIGRAISERRIFRLGYVHDGEHMEAEVGVPNPYGFEPSWERATPGEPELVAAILEPEDGPFLVCTENRGVARGEPILVGIGEAYEVVYFEDYGPDD